MWRRGFKIFILWRAAKRREMDLVQSAKTALDAASILGHPTEDHAAAWVLRTMYLRGTTCPHAAWIASCITMLTIEAVFTKEVFGTASKTETSAPGLMQNTETRNRIFSVARLLNTWVASEYGRSMVKIKGVSCNPPTPQGGDFTTDLLLLYYISEWLDPDQIFNAKDFEDGIAKVYAYQSPKDGITISQINVGFALYRRLRLVSPHISRETSSQIISLGVAGLEAVMRLAKARLP